MPILFNRIFSFVVIHIILFLIIFIFLDKIAKTMRITKKAEESEIDRDVRRSWTSFLKDCYEADPQVRQKKKKNFFLLSISST